VRWLSALFSKPIPVEQRLYHLLSAPGQGQEVEAEALLLSAPANFDINWQKKHSYNGGFLHIACLYNRHRLVAALLRHPGGNPNLKDNFDETPFHLTCGGNRDLQSFCLLFDDPRVDINARDKDGWTGLMLAAFEGSASRIEYALASLRWLPEEMILLALEKARLNGKTEVVELLEAYLAQPFFAMKNLRIKLDLKEYGPVSYFVLVVLLCDGYFSLLAESGGNNQLMSEGSSFGQLNSMENGRKARKFFEIMGKLPMDLQMVICNRIYDLQETIIRPRLVNTALKLMISDGALK